MSIMLALTISLSLFGQDRDAVRYWNEVLDRYEQLCNACLEHRSTREVKNSTDALQEILKKPVGSMTAEQQRRFTSIQRRYKGISEEVPTIVEQPLNIVKIDTVRRVEHVKVIDTVFVKEILGEVAILQQMSRRDTVVHIIRQDETPAPLHTVDTVYIEHSPLPVRKAPKEVGVSILAELGALPIPSYGAMVAIGNGNGFGGYLKFCDSFHHPSVSGQCSSSDNVWTTGKVEMGRTSFTAGGMMKMLPWCSLYAGAGYGIYELAWEDANGRWLSVEDGSGQGLALDLGVLCSYRFLAFSFGVNYTSPRFADLEFGIGVRF